MDTAHVGHHRPAENGDPHPSQPRGSPEDSVVATGAVWSTFYDVRRYGGLQMLLRALLGDGSMILSDANESPTDFLTRLGKGGVTPHLRHAVTLAPRADESSGHRDDTRYVRLSGEIADQAIPDSLHRTYPKAILAHAYDD